jgi:serine/threonine-protein kinase
MSAPVREGDILAGKYKVERVLAQGGMGVVVAAMHQQLEQRVALKFLLPDCAADDDMLGRFLREAKAAVRLRSEHVARVLDVGTTDQGSPYIVMEYLEGCDLASLLEEQRRLPVPTALAFVLQAAEAVAEAHALGIVHRDLKPANLFLTKHADGTPCVKVLDFGISKLASTIEKDATKTSAMMGTPVYMAPEQLRSSKNVDQRSDIWSLGMILYELLTGNLAFQRDTLPALCTSILHDPPSSLRDAAPDLPAALDAVVLRALEKSPDARHQDLAELADDLAPFTPDGPELAARIHRVLGKVPPVVIQTKLSPAPALRMPPASAVDSVDCRGSVSASPREEELEPPLVQGPRRAMFVALAVLGLAAAVGLVAVVRAGRSASTATSPAATLAPAQEAASAGTAATVSELVDAPVLAATPDTSSAPPMLAPIDEGSGAMLPPSAGALPPSAGADGSSSMKPRAKTRAAATSRPGGEPDFGLFGPRK